MNNGLIYFRGQAFVDCAESRFHIRTIEWADNWLEKPANELPGTLTHNKVAQTQIDSEVALIGYLRVYAH